MKWMNTMFDNCVEVLEILAEMFNITYEEANVVIFCIIEPIIIIVLILYIIRLRKELKTFKIIKR